MEPNTRRPRVLMVSRTRYRLPLSVTLERKFAALDERLDVHVLAAAADRTSAGEHGMFTLVAPLRLRPLDGALYYLALPFRIARAARRLRPDAILAQGPYEAAAAALARTRAKVVVEVHGDWRTATRVYGSRLRRALSPLADAVAAWGLRRADRVRTLSPFTTELVRAVGVEPTDAFPAFVDLETFLETPPAPLPERPAFLFVGVLERYKFVDGLVDAWRRVALEAPEATLRIVGDGTERARVEALVAQLPERTRWDRRLAPDEVRAALDEAAVLLLPSRSEGLPRIAIEALSRGRPVIGARAGGIPDIVQDGAGGIVIARESVDALVEAMLLVARDQELVERLAAAARPAAERWQLDPAEYAERLRALVES
jgi:glycosyltransferase involved in cell wall biosynthesis